MTWIVCKATTGEDGITTVIASTPTSDRYGDVVSAPWQLERFRANPVVVWAHDYSTPPIGKAVSVEMDGPDLVAKIQWDDSPSNPLGQTVAHQFRSGFLNAVSVGFQPGKSIRRNALDEDHPHYSERGNLYRDSELLEISAVPIPANPDALAKRSLSPFLAKHIVSVEDTDDGVVVTYAKGAEPAEDEPAPEGDAVEVEESASEWWAEEGATAGAHEDDDDESVSQRTVRDELIALLLGDESVQAALDELSQMRRDATCGISAIDDIFGFTD